MSLLTRYDPPAYLADFNRIPGQLEAWHRAVSTWFDAVIAIEAKLIGTAPQYYNAAAFDPGGVVVEQPISWNAFPKELLRRYGRERALQLADELWPLEHFRLGLPDPANPKGTSGFLYRPQEEYCEWHVLRDPNTRKIQRITFTSEPPEYWQALAGVVPGSDQIPEVTFPGDKQVLLALYHEVVSPHVKIEDLIPLADIKNAQKQVIAPKGQYNIYNRWNSELGIAHLHSPPNSLVAEIQLGGDASVLRNDPSGLLLAEPDALICNADYGGPNRNSDPTIGSTVNALARLGAYVTLKNPVGLYMDHIDLSGWEAPDGGDVADFLHIVRGSPGMIERLVIEAPPGRNLAVGDLSIAGVPLRYGGQAAECITVKLVGIANILPKSVSKLPVTSRYRGFLDPAYPSAVGQVERERLLTPGTIEAYESQGTVDITRLSITGPSASISRMKISRSVKPPQRVDLPRSLHRAMNPNAGKEFPT
jgi:hypothetical protein